MRRTTYKELCDNVETNQLINEKFEECKHLIKNIRKDNLMQRLRDKELSLVQSLDRLDDEICWGLLGIWGLAYDDISEIDLSYLTAQQLSRIAFSKQTKFPDKEFLPNGFNQNEIINSGLNYKGCGVDELHKKGITGKGITIAVIDKAFLPHNEFKGKDFEIISTHEQEDYNFHGLCVVSRVIGNNLGIAPDCNLIFYAVNDCETIFFFKQYIDALKDILSKVEHGEKIDIISISASIKESGNDYVGKEEIIKQYNAITTKLKSLGCEIIASDDFWRNGFSYAYKIDNLVDNKNLDNYVSVYAGKNNETLNVLDGGKCEPFVFTENDYIYSGCKGSASYSIPQVSSMLALAKQLKKDITFEEFSELARKTCATNKNGTKFVDMVSLIKNLEITNEAQEEITK